MNWLDFAAGVCLGVSICYICIFDYLNRHVGRVSPLESYDRVVLVAYHDGGSVLLVNDEGRLFVWHPISK